jgi:transposase
VEESSGDRRRLGHISKQGQLAVALLIGGSGAVTEHSIPEWRSKYFYLAMRRERKIAKVAMARRLPVSLCWMWRKGRNCEPCQSSARTRGTP